MRCARVCRYAPSLNAALSTALACSSACSTVEARARSSPSSGNGSITKHAGVQMPAVAAGATVVCFSFIGFDAITMYSEEAKAPDTVPKAIVLALLIGGAIFFVAAWFSQAVFLTLQGFQVTDDTLPEMALKVGG